MEKDKFEYLRKKVDSKKKLKTYNIDNLTKGEIESFIHNFEVSQIELEVQNEELQDAKSQLEKVKNEYLELFEHAPVGYLTIGREFNIVKSNATFSNFIGIPKNELENKAFSSFIFPSFQDEFYLYSKKNLRNTQGIIIKLKHPTKHYVWAQINLGTSENKESFFMSISDVSEKQKNQERLAKLEKVANIGSFEYDFRTHQKKWSQQIYKIFGFEEGKQIDDSDFDYKKHIHPDDYEKVIAAQESAFQNTGTMDLVYRILTINNEIKYVRGIASIEYDSVQKPDFLFGTLQDVTENKIQQQKQREADNLFKNITQNAKDAIILIDSEDEIKFWNKSAEKIFGLKQTDALGKNLHNMILPKRYISSFKKGFAQFKESGTGNAIGKTVQLIGQRINGEEFDAEISISTIEIEGKIHAIGIVRDISERLLKDKRIKMLSDIVEQAPTTIMTTDLDGYINYINPAFEINTGYTAQEALGKHSSIVKSEFTKKDTYKRLWQKLTNNEIWRGEFSNKMKNGNYYFEFAVVAPLFDENQKKIGYFAIKNNITKRKKAERELKASEHKFKLLFENLPIGILMANIHGQIHNSNHALIKILGSPSIEATRKINLKSLPQLKNSGFNEAFVKAIQTKSTQFVENYYTSKWGSEAYISASITPLIIEDNQMEDMFVLLQDITERKKAELSILKRDNYLTSLNKIAGLLLNRFEENVFEKFTQIIGNVAKASRVYLIKNVKNRDSHISVNLISEYRAEGVESLRKFTASKHFSYQSFSLFWYQKLTKGEFIYAKISELIPSEQKIFKNLGVKAILLLPILIDDYFWGLIGIDNCNDESQWSDSEVNLLRTTTFDLSQYLRRKQAEENLKESEHKYSTLFEKILNPIVVVDVKGFIVQYNKAAYTELGYTKEEYAKLHISDIDMFDDQTMVQKRIAEILEKGSATFETKHKKKNGETLDVIVTSSFLAIKDKLYTLASFNDITPIKKAQSNLQLSEEKYRNLAENSIIAILIHNTKGEIKYINKKSVELVNGNEVKDLLNMNINNFLLSEDLEVTNAAMSKILLKDKSIQREQKIKRLDGQLIDVEVVGVKTFFGGEESIQLTLNDITERKQAEIKERNSKENFKFLSETATILLSLKTEDEIIKFLCKTLSKLIPKAYHAIGIVNKLDNTISIKELSGLDPNKFFNILNKLGIRIKGHNFKIKHDLKLLYPNSNLKDYENGISELFNYEFSKKSSEILMKTLSLSEIFGIGLYPDEEIYAGIHIFTHHNYQITNKSIIEIFIQQVSARLKIILDNQKIVAQNLVLKEQGVELESALEMKNVLLKEVHHRVKNNLQTIKSLLFQQQHLSSDENIKAVLQDSMNRVGSMALIHEQIYRSEDLENISVRKYITDFARQLVTTYRKPGISIDLKIDIDDVFLNLDTAIPIALILNELLSNVFKYAFPEMKEGIIFVKFEKVEQEKLKLIVADNGIGLPENFKSNKSKSLGMFIIKNIATRQLRGELIINSAPNKGSEFIIIF